MEGNNIELLKKYFPVLAAEKLEKYDAFATIFKEWNQKINLVSKNDSTFLFERHILHSLAIAKFIKFKPGSAIMDLGTGGGFPGLPLAIMFPEVTFTLVDSIGKKIRVVSDLIAQLDLQNAVAECNRAENLQGQYDFVVSRATAPLNDLYRWSRQLISRKQQNAIPNGIICLKGGDIDAEIQPFRGRTEVVPVSDYFAEDYFLTKKLIFLTT
jgi:16S rRNA (guanine527-N7)-methyltransferase